MPPRVRGLDEIKPFLKQVGKIITIESQKYDTTDSLSWYKTWESWDKQDILTRTSMNSITNIICPDLFYNQRTIKAVVNRCLEKIPPIESYIDITHLSDKSVEWTSRVGDIASFKSIKMRSRNSKSFEKRTNSKKNHTDPKKKRTDPKEIHTDSLNIFDSRKSIPIPSINSSISTSPSHAMDTAPLPTTIHIDNDASLTTQAYSVLKLTAIAELEEATTKGKKSIDTAVTIATNTAIAELKTDYESTLTYWDTTKATLDQETKQAISDIQHALDESSQVTENVSQITKDLEETK